MLKITSYIKSIKYILSVISFNEKKIDKLKFTDEHYIWLDNKLSILITFPSPIASSQ